MRTENRAEVTKFFESVYEGKPMILMTFQPPMIGVFNNKEDIDIALRDETISKVYTTLNQVKKSALEHLPQNRLTKMQKGRGINKDDIASYQFLFVDIDVCGLERTDGNKRNATDEEHERARSVCIQAKNYLTSLGLPDPVIIDSCNGFHCLYRVECISATLAHEKMFKEAIQAIAEKIDTGEVKIDCVVADRGRKLKVPGSANNLSEANSRYSSIVELPEQLLLVTEQQIKELVAQGSRKSSTKYKGSPGSDKDEDKSMVELAEEIGDYFMSDTRQVLSNVQVDGGKVITMNVSSREFRLFLRRQMKERLDIKVITNDMWKSLVDYLEVLASEEGKEVKKIYNRIGQFDGTIYYDLGDEDHQSVAIRPGEYEIVDTPPCVFQRTDLDRKQVFPIEDDDFDFWGTLSKFFNLRSQEELELLGIWLICSFVPDISKPLLLFSGAFASGKSTASSLLQELINPVTVQRSSFPRKLDDLAVRLANTCLCSFDNCDRITTEASNLMCLSVTGGSYEKRRLYKNVELVTIPLRSMIIMNSCEAILEKPDILSRTLQFNLQQIPAENLRNDESITREFEEYKPYFLDYIFVKIAEAMTLDDEEIHYVTRLTDWQKMSAKIARVTLNVKTDYMEHLLKSNQNDINVTLIESNPVAVLILRFMEQRQSWRGSVTELYNELDHLAFKEDIERNNRLYPRNPSSLSMRLNSLAGTLAQVGITFYIRPVGTYKEIQLKNSKTGGK